MIFENTHISTKNILNTLLQSGCTANVRMVLRLKRLPEINAFRNVGTSVKVEHFHPNKGLEVRTCSRKVQVFFWPDSDSEFHQVPT